MSRNKMMAAHQFIAGMHDLQNGTQTLYAFRAWPHNMGYMGHLPLTLGFAKERPIPNTIEKGVFITPLGEEFNAALDKIEEGYRALHKVLDKIP